MKKRILFAVPAIVGGLLLAIGTNTVFAVCPPSHHSGMREACFYSARVIAALGVIIALTGFIKLFAKSCGFQSGLAVSVSLNSILSLLTANVLVGVHFHTDMDCNAKSLPAWNVISSIILIISVAELIFLAFAQFHGGKTNGKDYKNEPPADVV